jgi:hypothetical protein
MTKLAIINNITKICENISSDNRQANEINIEGYTVLDLDNTSTITWSFNETLKDFEQFEGIGDGGIGLTTSITGTSTYYAGGGGGGTYYYSASGQGNGPAGAGGSGGGGAGGRYSGAPAVGTAGTTNLGGGGGGGAGFDTPTVSYNGGNGGSGFVVVRYLGPQRASGGAISISGGYTIHTFTNSGTFTA